MPCQLPVGSRPHTKNRTCMPLIMLPSVKGLRMLREAFDEKTRKCEFKEGDLSKTPWKKGNNRPTPIAWGLPV